MAAESEHGGERTEEPSQKRLEEARKLGQVPRSRELGNFATMIGGSAALVSIGGTLTAHLSQVMRRGLAIDPQALRDPGSMLTSFDAAASSALSALLPLFGAVIVLAVLASVALGGWNFSLQALVPDLTRTSPRAGLERLFGLRGISELGKALFKCVVVGALCAAIVASIFELDLIA